MESKDLQIKNIKQLQNSVFLPQVAELIREGHSVTITARGYSMMPFIEHNRDLLIFSQAGDVHVGDVVLAEISKGVFVCHRVDALQGDRLTLRGDGNVFGTEHCTLLDVRARLSAVVRKGKRYNLDTSRAWRIYSCIWPRLLPVRRYLLALYRLLWNHQLPRRFRRHSGRSTEEN